MAQSSCRSARDNLLVPVTVALHPHSIFAAKMKINEMVSTRSLSWTCVLVQLVLSCASLLASLAIIAAIFQSTSIYPERQQPSTEWYVFCALSVGMIGATVMAMFGLAGHNTNLLLPHIILLGLCTLFVGRCLWVILTDYDPSNFNWYISHFTHLSCFISFIAVKKKQNEEVYENFKNSMMGTTKVAVSRCPFICSVFPGHFISTRDEDRIFSSIKHSRGALIMEQPHAILTAEMIYLIVGETGIGMLHGWTEGVVYQLKEYYTPLWTCACLMVLLLLLIISLVFVFILLYCNQPGIITHHYIALYASWPLAVGFVIGGLCAGGPFLTAIVLIAYSTGLLGFAYLYQQTTWVATFDPPVA